MHSQMLLQIKLFSIRGAYPAHIFFLKEYVTLLKAECDVHHQIRGALQSEGGSLWFCYRWELQVLSEMGVAPFRSYERLKVQLFILKMRKRKGHSVAQIFRVKFYMACCLIK